MDNFKSERPPGRSAARTFPAVRARVLGVVDNLWITFEARPRAHLDDPASANMPPSAEKCPEMPKSINNAYNRPRRYLMQIISSYDGKTGARSYSGGEPRGRAPMVDRPMPSGIVKHSFFPAQ